MTIEFPRENLQLNKFDESTYKKNMSDFHNLPEELIRVILSYYPEQKNAFICKKFYRLIDGFTKNFNHCIENKKIYQVFHKSILKNLIIESDNHLETHKLLVEAAEKLYPFAKGLPFNINNEIKNLLKQAENSEINKIINFWESCHGDMSFLSFNDIVLLDCILNGHYQFALEVFNIHPDYPLNISPWKMNGEVCENKAYTEKRNKIITCIGSFLISENKTHELLIILSKEYQKIIEANFTWGNLISDCLQTEILKALDINIDTSEENLLKTFSDLFQKCKKNEFIHLLIGLALIYPQEEALGDEDLQEENQEVENDYTKALQGAIEVNIEQELQENLITKIIDILNCYQKY